jgi:S1/P1 nuclease
MKRMNLAIALFVSILTLPLDVFAWNIPGHMLGGAIAYQILQRESPTTIGKIRAILEKNPWFDTRWKSQLQKLPDAERDEMLFMLAAWADDIRTGDKAESRLPWHYVDFPFKPEGEPPSIQPMQPPQENILTAIAENTRILRTGNDSAR